MPEALTVQVSPLGRSVSRALSEAARQSNSPVAAGSEGAVLHDASTHLAAAAALYVAQVGKERLMSELESK